MRITGGIYRGRRITCPKFDIRPAMDRMRESLFAILRDLSGMSFCDCFAGSGVVGIEALSRGAEYVVFVERDPRKKKYIRQNLTMHEGGTKILIMPVQRFFAVNRERFDYLYLDPPFDFSEKISLLTLARDGNILKSGGVCIIHHPTREKFPPDTAGMKCFDCRVYGGSSLSFYRNNLIPETGGNSLVDNGDPARPS